MLPNSLSKVKEKRVKAFGKERKQIFHKTQREADRTAVIFTFCEAKIH
jgi:hypothetical protein